MYTPTQAQAQAQAHAHIQLIIRHNDELSDSLYIFFFHPIIMNEVNQTYFVQIVNRMNKPLNR